jgi:hypothetical protein
VRRFAFVVMGVVVATCLGSCQGKSKSPPPVAKDATAEPGPAVTRVVTPTAEPIFPPEPPVAMPQQASFQLVAPGAAPRTRLRYRYAEGTHQVAAEARIRSRRLSSDGWSPTVEVPAFEEGFEVAVGAPAAGGTTLLLRGLPASASAGDASARWKALIENKRGQVAIDDRGQLGTIAMAEDPTGGRSRAVLDEIAQRWLTALVPLPAEAVGKGARWRVVTLLRAGDAVVKQTVEYTLIERRKDAWVIDVNNKRVAEQQTMTPAGLPKGTVAELIALFRQLQGRVTVKPDLPWPDGELAAELRVHGRLAIPGKPIDEHVTEDIGIVILRRR